MTLESIRLALATRMVAWPDAPLAFDGLPAPAAVNTAQTNGDPWVRVTILHGDGRLATLADEAFRSGMLWLQIFTKDGQGERPATLLTDSLAAHLEHYRAGNLTLRQANAQRVGPDNGWYQYNLRIPFIAL